MTDADIALLIVAVLLVPIAGAFAALDASLSRVSAARVDELVRESRSGAVALSKILTDRARHTNLLLLLRVAAEITATVFVTVAFIGEVGSAWDEVLAVVAIMVVVSYVLVGVGPRTLGRQHPYTIGLIGSRVVLALGWIFGPLASLLILLGNAITPGRGYREGPFSSEVEIRELVDLAEARGVVERGEREMIQSVFELGDTIAREVMVPRTDVVWIEVTKTVPQALALALRSGFSRIPVVADNVDDIVGLVYLKDLVRRGQDPDRARLTKLDEVMRSPIFVPESKPVDALLRDMQATNSHLAVVIDEYGGTAGLVTIEDILEEIVGEIHDEYDVEQELITELEDGSVRLTARLPVEDLGAMFGVELPKGDDVETVGGLMAQLLGRVPISRLVRSCLMVWRSQLRAQAAGATGSTRSSLPNFLIRTMRMTMAELSAEDAKLVTLARANRARAGSIEGAAVRDTDGRTYSAATVSLPSMSLSALQVAVAMAVSSGAPGLEAAMVVGDRLADAAGTAAVADVAASVVVRFADSSGTVAG